MTEYTIRFIGDPTGYRLTTNLEAMELVAQGWIQVYVGNTKRIVSVDVAKAYLIDADSEQSRRLGIVGRVARAHTPTPEVP